MSDYPDPDEEYELMYADELEMINEEEPRSDAKVVRKKPLPAKRSLDFSSPFTNNTLNSFDVNNVPTPSTIPVDPPGSEEITLTPTIPLEDLTPSTNKRTAYELFGDIEDIDFNEMEMPSKKQKTEEEVDLDLIEKILEGRRLKQILAEPSSRLLANKCSYNVKDNLSLDIPRWAFMPLTNSDGDRVYVRFESEESWEKSLDSTTEQTSLHATYANTWVEARKILEAKQQQQTEEHLTQSLPDIDADVNNNMLWVDKYRPTSYLDLLSEEPVNRALLHWLHLWDKIVFKKEVKTKEPQQRTTFSKRAGQFQLTNKWKGKRETEPEVDEDGRPHYKVALLCGPPGVGKTTLAHLLARIAGYRPVELNASDERSTEAFRNAIQSATLMRSVLDVDRRPNCLILDEIDGAPLPTVELLVRWCTATATEGKGKSKTKTQPLKRPIIAICNDLYATSLRPLRAVSLVVQVGGASAARLAARLAHVCAREGLRISAHVASALAARAQGDVRAAIQVLSFIKAKAKRPQLNMADVENAAIGTKDCHKSLMQALQAVFTVNDKDPGALLKTINAAGEYDRLADGIFEHYLTARVDGRFRIACETLSWLMLHDTISSWTSRTQNYSLYSALPLCLASCHSVLASRTPQRIGFPKQAMEMHRTKVELDSIVSAVERGSSPSVSNSRSALRFDILPLAPYLLTPQLRSANVQFCSEVERKTIRVCASAMCDYALQYVQVRSGEGLYTYVLEPDVNKVAFFGSEEKVRPPPAIRQAIAREQQLEVIRRNEEMANRVPARSKTDDVAHPSTSKKDDKQGGTGKAKQRALPNHLQQLKPKEITKITPQVHKDFFGRVVPISHGHRSDAVPDVIASSSVFYQYQEGFNNAVRRNVRTKDLL
ncbi:unnamed protein product [Arctia plantaginis]|uniref:AAA+ ATPase domain-containing protein n=1 Tax=Arctia plantaginis TaxID=874455 RepID=A0A8S1B299_ARCPL|nr:unnamed protein product [Arctia plantaginis]